MSQQLPDTAENFEAFMGVVPDIKKGKPREIEEELFKKSWQKKAVDSFEAKLGIPVKKETTPSNNTILKHKLFQMEYDKDGQLFNELMNSPKYKIIMMEKTWTVDGNFRMFVVYSDDLDFKPEKKEHE